MPIRVLVVDDHPLVRLGLRQALAAAADIEIASEAASGVEALRRLAEDSFDVVILDISMPGRHGVEVLKRVVTLDESPPVLIYTRFPEEQYAVRSLRAGAAGYLMKTGDPAELVTAVRRLAQGENYVSPRVAALLEQSPSGTARGHEALSEREFEVLRMIVSGRSVSAIASELSLSVKTVSTHRVRLLRKLGLTSTADLVHYAIEQGIDDSAS